MIIESQLEKIGLPRDQAKVYLCLLNKGPQFLQEIARETGIKRTSLYLVIEKMIERNLVGIEIKGKRKKYYIKNPEILLMKLKEQKNLLEALMPQLENIYKYQSKENKLRFYDTQNGLKQTLKEINKLDAKKDELLTIEGNIHEAFKLGYDFWKELLAEKKYLGIKSRTIIPSEEKEEFVIKNHAIKLRITNILNEFKIMLYLFQNKTIIMIPRDNFCTVIENQEIKKAFENLFEIIWRRSKPIN
jgi:sugar-specific transcriptional regulator TrmB